MKRVFSAGKGNESPTKKRYLNVRWRILENPICNLDKPRKGVIGLHRDTRIRDCSDRVSIWQGDDKTSPTGIGDQEGAN